MATARFIDIKVEGVNVKYLSMDGNPPDDEAYERIRKQLLETFKRFCPQCKSTSISTITENILLCNACSYEDLDTFFYH